MGNDQRPLAKGRAAQIEPPNRFETLQCEDDLADRFRICPVLRGSFSSTGAKCNTIESMSPRLLCWSSAKCKKGLFPTLQGLLAVVPLYRLANGGKPIPSLDQDAAEARRSSP